MQMAWSPQLDYREDYRTEGGRARGARSFQFLEPGGEGVKVVKKLAVAHPVRPPVEDPSKTSCSPYPERGDMAETSNGTHERWRSPLYTERRLLFYCAK